MPLQTVNVNLRAYNNQSIHAEGKIIVNIKRDKTIQSQTLYVINRGGVPILGREWMYYLGMWPLQFSQKAAGANKEVKFIYDVNRAQVQELRTEFPEVFRDGFGLFNHGVLSLKVKPNTIPKFFQPRKIPFALIPKVKVEIYRLQENKTLIPIEYSEWGTPIVPIIKSNGSVRICGDFKVTVHPFLEIDHFPSP